MTEYLNEILRLPVQDPVLIFSIVLGIILFAPLIFNKLRIPHIVGMILSGVILGPHALGVLDYDSSFKLFGQVGVLYIMFLAGVDMDMDDFKRNRGKSVVFGLFTFFIPMILGTLTGYFMIRDIYLQAAGDASQIFWNSGEPSTQATFIKYCWISALVLASMYASNTLVAYPIVSRFGVSRNRSVTITIGGTMITTILSLLVLVLSLEIVRRGTIDINFWWQFLLSNLVYALFMFLIVPRLARWFFKRFEDNITQYIFVLCIVFLSSFLAKLAGVEYIIGAFLAGINLNRLIPKRSPLMNRIDFVGNAIFIPFFLISVGMIVDFSIIMEGYATILAAVVMSVVATLAKYLAAVFTKWSFKMTKDEGMMIFGLSNAQAAATLAAVMIAYNLVIAVTPEGHELRLLSSEILNGTIIMILVTCAISSVVTERAARKLAISSEVEDNKRPQYESENRILIPLANPATVDSLMDLATLMKDEKDKQPIYALNVIDDHSHDSIAQGKKLLEKAATIGAAADKKVKMISRYDLNIASGISNVVKEKNISDVIMGLHNKSTVTDSFFGKMTDALLNGVSRMIAIFKSTQPISTIKRVIVAVPEGAEFESGFNKWLDRVFTLSNQVGAAIIFYTNEKTREIIKQKIEEKKISGSVSFSLLSDWDDFLILAKVVKKNDLLIVVTARKPSISYNPLQEKLPKQLSQYFQENSFIVLYPEQFKEGEVDKNINASHPFI